jgi:hypothetical protein
MPDPKKMSREKRALMLQLLDESPEADESAIYDAPEVIDVPSDSGEN